MSYERFWAKVQKGGPDECWPWLGYVGPSGHGRTSYKCYSIITSRKAWIATHGEVPHGRCVNHRCDNPLCCNPAHLYLGTRADNMIDRFGKLSPEDRKHQGRPHVLTESQVDDVLELRLEGRTLQQLADKFRVHTQTIRRILKGRKSA